LSFILNAAPNLFRLDLPFDYLLKLFEDQQICHLLGQRITSLSIKKNDTKPSLITLKKGHIPIIASVFCGVRDLFVDLEHLSRDATIVSKENIVEDPVVGVVAPFSSESVLLCLLEQFRKHKLIGLSIDGQFFEEIKTNTEQWLRDNTMLCQQKFKAVFSSEWNRLLIWL
jgi:hypothetical protein